MRFFLALFFGLAIIALTILVGESPLVPVPSPGGIVASLPEPSAARAAASSLGPRRIAENEFPALSAASAAVVDANTGVLLGEKEKDLVTPIASITKLMTALTFIELNPGWDRALTLTTADVRAGAGGIVLVRPGVRLTHRDAFHAMLVGSANNIAAALPRAVGLSIAEFTARMNETAEERGLSQTSFEEPTGLNDKNVSSALDIVRLAFFAFHQPDIRAALVLPEFEFTPIAPRIKYHIRTTNDLLTAETEGYRIVGAKTGFTANAGYTFVVEAEGDAGQRVIVALLNAPTEADRFADADRLIHWAFDTYEF